MSFAAAVLRSRRLGPESISQNPSEPLLSGFGGAPTKSGQRVHEGNATSIPVVFNCDRVLKESFAQVPIKVMRRQPDDTRVRDRNSPIDFLLHEAPNPVLSPYDFKETGQHHLNIWGNFYAEIVRDRFGVPTALWPLDPWRMAVELDDLNRLVYKFRLADGRLREWMFDPLRPPVLHVRQNSSDGINGRGPVTCLRENFGLSMARTKHQATVFGQGGHAQMGLKTEKALKPDAARRVRQDYEALTTGEENWHRVVLLDHGLEPVPLTMPFRDAQFLQNWRFGDSQLAGAFRVPLHMINDLERATFSNIEHQGIEFVAYTMTPHFIRWRDAIARDLIRPLSTEHFAMFQAEALVQTDIKTRNEALAVERQNGIISGNEWRRLTDKDDKIPASEGGDDYLANAALQPIRRDPLIDFGNTPGGES